MSIYRTATNTKSTSKLNNVCDKRDGLSNKQTQNLVIANEQSGQLPQWWNTPVSTTLISSLFKRVRVRKGDRGSWQNRFYFIRNSLWGEKMKGKTVKTWQQQESILLHAYAVYLRTTFMKKSQEEENPSSRAHAFSLQGQVTVLSPWKMIPLATRQPISHVWMSRPFIPLHSTITEGCDFTKRTNSNTEAKMKKPSWRERAVCRPKVKTGILKAN